MAVVVTVNRLPSVSDLGVETLHKPLDAAQMRLEFSVTLIAHVASSRFARPG